MHLVPCLLFHLRVKPAPLGCRKKKKWNSPGAMRPGFDYFSSSDWITSAAAVILSQKYSMPVRLPARACDSKHSVDDLISDTAAFSTLMLCSFVMSILLSLVNDWWIMYPSTCSTDLRVKRLTLTCALNSARWVGGWEQHALRADLAPCDLGELKRI